MQTVGAAATDWTNDNLFGDGFHLFGMEKNDDGVFYSDDADAYAEAMQVIDGFISYGEENGVEVGDIADAMDAESDEFDPANAAKAADELLKVFDADTTAAYLVEDEETLAKRLEEHRQEVHDRIAQEHPELAERFRERRHLLDEHLRERRPEVYELVIRLREKKDQA